MHHLLGFPTWSLGSDDPFTRLTLRGLDGVHVVVGLCPEVEQKGIEKKDIRKDIERELRLAGIKMLSKEELVIEPGHPILVLHMTCIKTEVKDKALYIFNVSVDYCRVSF